MLISLKPLLNVNTQPFYVAICKHLKSLVFYCTEEYIAIVHTVRKEKGYSYTEVCERIVF
jgi:hypothetical protein